MSNGNGKGGPGIPGGRIIEVVADVPKPEANSRPKCGTCVHWNRHGEHKGRCLLKPPRMEIVGMAEDMARQKAPVTFPIHVITFDEDYCAFHPEFLIPFVKDFLADMIPHIAAVWRGAVDRG